MRMRFEPLIAGAVLVAIGTWMIVSFLNGDFGRNPSTAGAAPEVAAAPVGLVGPLQGSGQVGMTPGPEPWVSMIPVAAPVAATRGAVAEPMGTARTMMNAGSNVNPETGGVPNYIGPVRIFEAHWQGMDARELSAELRQKQMLPSGLQGIILGEVTLNAAYAGLLGGDVIIGVGNGRVSTLEDFQRQTRAVRNLKQATITVLRKGELTNDGRFAMRSFTVVLLADSELGFAQAEGAPMILPGAPRPHPYRGPCTSCHTIGVGLEMTPDPDLTSLAPPSISQATAEIGISPHRDRGPCEACHRITF